MVARGELWWGQTADERGRPYLVVSRDAVIGVMDRVLVAPVTRRIRGLPSEVPVGPDDGLPVESVATFDNLRPIPKSMLVRRVGALHKRTYLICDAAAAAMVC